MSSAFSNSVHCTARTPAGTTARKRESPIRRCANSYCSELVWKAYDRGLAIDIGALQTLRDFNLTDAAVKAKMRERYGDTVPLNEPVISPVAMFRSDLLVTVAEQ